LFTKKLDICFKHCLDKVDKSNQSCLVVIKQLLDEFEYIAIYFCIFKNLQSNHEPSQFLLSYLSNFSLNLYALYTNDCG